MPVRSALVALVVVASAASGCLDPSLEGTPETCVNDVECAAVGDVCLFGVCAAADEGALVSVDLEVRPPDGSGLLTQQLRGVDTTVDDRIPITLKGAATVTGTVCTSPENNCGEGSIGVAARVVMVPAESIPGRRLAVSTDTSALGSYSVGLLEQAAYLARIYPNDEARAPFFPTTPVYTGAASSTTAGRDFRLPESASLVRVMGRVVGGEGAGAIEIPDVQVEVEDGGRRISSVARTGVDGRFTLSLAAPASVNALLFLKPTGENPLFPEVELGGLNLTATTDLGDIFLGAVVAPVPVSGVVTGNDGSPVLGATVYLRGDVGIGEVRRLLTTDDDGRFDADLPPGPYDVVAVAPTTDAEAGMYRSGVPLEVGPDIGPLDLVLSARVSVNGTVSSSSSEPVAGAALTFVRLGPPGGGTEPVLDGATWQFSTLTRGDGSFGDDGGNPAQAFRLDPGRYRVVCAPPEGSDAPSWTFVTDVFASPEPLAIALPPAAVFAGQLVAPGGGSVGGAEVRVYASIVSESGEAIPLGTARTDAEGRFGLRLPDLFAEPEDGGSPPASPDGGAP